MRKVYVMSGPSGAGKTTLAKDFANKNGLLYLGIDDFYRAIDPTYMDKFSVWQAFYQAIHYAETEGIDCIVDSDFRGYVERKDFLNWFSNFDEYHLICLDTSLLQCLHNNQIRDRSMPAELLIERFSQTTLPSQEECYYNWDVVSFVENIDNHFILGSIITKANARNLS